MQPGSTNSTGVCMWGGGEYASCLRAEPRPKQPGSQQEASTCARGESPGAPFLFLWGGGRLKCHQVTQEVLGAPGWRSSAIQDCSSLAWERALLNATGLASEETSAGSVLQETKQLQSPGGRASPPRFSCSLPPLPDWLPPRFYAAVKKKKGLTRGGGILQGLPPSTCRAHNLRDQRISPRPLTCPHQPGRRHGACKKEGKERSHEPE